MPEDILKKRQELTDIMNSGKIETSPDNQIKDYGAKELMLRIYKSFHL
jgi:hypothetical protein